MRPNAKPSNGDLHLVRYHKKVFRRLPGLDAQIILECLTTQIHVGLRLHEPDSFARDQSISDARFVILFPSVETPNVGQVVNYPPADVVTSRLVLAARITEAEYDLQSLSSIYFFESLSSSPSSSSLPLPMTSGSAAAAPASPSAAGAAAASSMTARGAAQTQTEPSGSSKTSTPAGTVMSLTCSESPMMRFVTSTSMWLGMSAGSTLISSSRKVWSSTPPPRRTPSGIPIRTIGMLTMTFSPATSA